MIPITSVLTGSYNLQLVALSVLIAVCGSYAALYFVNRVTVAQGRALVFWLVMSSFTMGLGIWSTHYVAMLAFHLPVPVSYDWPTVMVSLRVAIFASGIAIFMVTRESVRLWRTAVAGVVLGVGISAMHYIGMAAMRTTAQCHFDFRLVALSIALAIVLSFAALRMSLQPRQGMEGAGSRKLAGAAVMGLSIAALHFTGMAAVRFSIGGMSPDLSHVMSINMLGAAGIAIVTMILIVALLASVFDRRISAQNLELESAEERYRLLFERSMAGVVRTSLEGRILECNLACAHLFGYDTCEEMTANSFCDRYFDPQDRSAFLERLQKARSLTNLEECLRRKDGSKVWTLGSANLVEGKGGRPTVIERTFVDLTESKRAAEIFRKAFNANPEPITIATIPDGRYLDVNESFVRVTGYSREEVIGRTSRDLKFWGKSEERTDFLDKIMREGSVRDLEISFRTKSGEMRAAMDSAEVVDVGGQQCAIAIFRDVTERKSLENQLRQTQKMEAVGQLSGGIAHDFNNLLGVIMGYGEILELRLPPGDPLHKECAQIMKAAQSAASLTRQLLAFSRQQVLEPRILDLNAIVLNVEKMLRRLIGKHIDLRTHLDSALGSVKADQSQIEQVILNLVVNARDAMPQGGKLVLKTANVNVDEEYARLHPPQLPGPYVLLSVSDTGTGMDAETQAHIFEPFFTTKEIGKGTGLGLSTVYGVVRQSGGHIWVESEPGKGATFRIYLPRAAQTARAQHAPAARPESLRGSETILVVEDDEVLRGLTLTLLQDAGYGVLAAGTAEAAIEIALRHGGPIHLLLTDIMMPGIGGRDLVAKLAPIRPETRIVYMSGYTGFTQAGAADSEITVLVKPFTRDTLLRKVRETFDSELKLEAK